jgi:hypothetical protein
MMVWEELLAMSEVKQRVWEELLAMSEVKQRKKNGHHLDML